MKQYWSKYKSILGVGGTILLLYSILFSFGITCPIKYLTGISCPGCGMSRAYFSLFSLDFKSAFYYHPLFGVIPFVVGIWIFFRVTQKKREIRYLFVVTVAAFFLVFFIRLFGAFGDVVVFSPKDGLIYRAIEKIINFLL